MQRSLLRTAAVTITAAVLLSTAPTSAGAAAPPPAPPLVTAKPLPAPVTNGTVWALAHHAGVVYVGGTFTTITPPGGRPLARRNLAAVDARTGAVLPWAPRVSAPTYRPPTGQRPDVACHVDWARLTQVCDTVYELLVHGGRLYAAGDFQAVNGQPRSRVAAFSLATGALDASFRTGVINARVRALAARPGVLYLGGMFTTVAGLPRARVAAVSDTRGGLAGWSPAVDRPVWAMTYVGGRLVIGGEFNVVAGVRIHGLAALLVTAPRHARMDWRGVPLRSAVTDLVTDGRSVFVAAEGAGTWDGTAAVDAGTGALRWFNDCRGATWSLALARGVLYAGSHAHSCAAIGAFGEQHGKRYYRLLAQPAYPPYGRPALYHWFPTTNGGDYSLPTDRTPSRLGPRVMAVAGDCLWLGGQFTTVNDRPQRSLTRFCPRPAATIAPSTPPAPRVVAVPRGAWLTWPTSEDLDDATLTYVILRNGRQVWTGKVTSAPWQKKTMSLTHVEAPTGTYQVRVSDGRNTVTGPPTRYQGN